eukprot:EG_transcript_15246
MAPPAPPKATVPGRPLQLHALPGHSSWPSTTPRSGSSTQARPLEPATATRRPGPGRNSQAKTWAPGSGMGMVRSRWHLRRSYSASWASAASQPTRTSVPRTSRLWPERYGPKITAPPVGCRTSHTRTVRSQPPLSSTWRSSSCHFTAYTRLPWPVMPSRSSVCRRCTTACRSSSYTRTHLSAPAVARNRPPGW